VLQIQKRRSKGPAFKNGKDVSLHWDQEASTTHGKFALVDGQLAITDLGSTNDSYVRAGRQRSRDAAGDS